MESQRNIRFVDPYAAPKPQAKYRKMSARSFIGKKVKKRFDSSRGAEHMWVEITHARTGGKICGNLSNEPIRAIYVREGAFVCLTTRQIEDVRRRRR